MSGYYPVKLLPILFVLQLLSRFLTGGIGHQNYFLDADITVLELTSGQ